MNLKKILSAQLEGKGCFNFMFPHYCCKRLVIMALFICFTLLYQPAKGQENAKSGSGKKRDVVDIRPNEEKPPGIRAIAPLNEANVVFLSREGLVGIAKFTPGLGLIAWDLYSKVKQDSLSGIVPGKNLSVLSASTAEITQAFDTDDNLKLDFYQALISDWPGKTDGVVITAGPVSDGSGRIFFALSPHQAEKEAQAKASVVSWHPKVKGIKTVTTSMLPIRAMAISPDGVLAARLYMPEYKDGFWVSLNRLPPFDPGPAKPGVVISEIPSTKPSILIPAELTNNSNPEQLCFIKEDGVEKILVTYPGSNQIIEIIPLEVGPFWQGSILMREKTESAVETLCFLGKDRVLGGGPEGFMAIDRNDDIFRILSMTLADDGIELRFSRPVNRFSGTRPDSFLVKANPLQGEGEKGITIPEPMIESDGQAIILRSGSIPADSVLRIKCMNITSETGEKLANPMAFYTIHQR